MLFFCVVITWILKYTTFQKMYCLHIRGSSWRQYVSPKRLYLRTSSHRFTNPDVQHIFTAVEASYVLFVIKHLYYWEGGCNFRMVSVYIPCFKPQAVLETQLRLVYPEDSVSEHADLSFSSVASVPAANAGIVS
jgi:hypothetical protein